MLRVAVVALMAASAAGSATILGAHNFDSEVFAEGANAFVKFYAPWCGHCKKMAGDWNKLAGHFRDSNVLIGDVDATVHTELASKYDVKGYPTLLYFTAGNKEPQVYEGGRSLQELEDFVGEHLHIKCKIEDESDCTEKEKGYISKLRKQGKEEVHKQYDRLAKQNPAHLKADLKGWRAQRMHILEQFKAKGQ